MPCVRYVPYFSTSFRLPALFGQFMVSLMLLYPHLVQLQLLTSYYLSFPARMTKIYCWTKPAWLSLGNRRAVSGNIFSSSWLEKIGTGACQQLELLQVRVQQHEKYHELPEHPGRRINLQHGQAPCLEVSLFADPSNTSV